MSLGLRPLRPLLSLGPETLLTRLVFADDLIPPLDLLEMIVSWISEDSRLILITFLNTPIAPNLPIGFLELTPLTGLIRWCVKAPLAYRRRKRPSLANGHVATKAAADSAGLDRDPHLLYSKLHLSVLQVLMVLQVHLTEKSLYGRLGLVLFDHMVPLVEEINRLADELNPLNASQEIELSLDRLAQALQVAMASGALLCTRGGWLPAPAFLGVRRHSPPTEHGPDQCRGPPLLGLLPVSERGRRGRLRTYRAEHCDRDVAWRLAVAARTGTPREG